MKRYIRIFPVVTSPLIAMGSKLSNLMCIVTSILLISGCAVFSNSEPVEPVEPVQAGQLPASQLKPEIDHSGETPDCVTAGERLAEHIEVGMTLKDVTRLVGQPFYQLPGSWRWSNTFGSSGIPTVRFLIGAAHPDSKVTSVVTENFNC